MIKSLFAQIVAAVVVLAGLQEAAATPIEGAAATLSKRQIASCISLRQYPAIIKGDATMTPNNENFQKGAGGNTQLDYTAQTWQYGLAMVRTHHYANMQPHLQVYLSTSGKAPSFLLYPSNGFALAYDIPDGQSACKIEYQPDIRINGVQVYAKGTQPHL